MIGLPRLGYACCGGLFSKEDYIGPRNSIFDGLCLVRQGKAIEISYPSRIQPSEAALTAARSHGLAARIADDQCWTVSDEVSAGGFPDRLATFFAHLNRFPAPYPPPCNTGFDLHALPLISCIIVVNENLPFVHSQLLPSLAANSRGYRLEVILVVNGSSVEAAVSVPVKCIRSEWGSVAAAYNRGADQAQGEFLAFLHDDVVIDDDQWIDKCLDALKGGAIAAAGEYRHLESIAGKAIPRLPIAKAVPLFLRHSSFRQIGGFDEFHYVGYEDLDFTLSMLQQGGKVAYPDIRLRHFNGMSSTLKYCPVKGLDQLYALAALPRGAIRGRFREFAQYGIVRNGVDFMRLALDVQLLYILRKYRVYLEKGGERIFGSVSDELARSIGRNSPVDGTLVLPYFREMDRLLYGTTGSGM